MIRGSGSWFPNIIIGFIVVLIAINVLPALLAPYMGTVIIAVLALLGIWFVSKLSRFAERGRKR